MPDPDDLSATLAGMRKRWRKAVKREGDAAEWLGAALRFATEDGPCLLAAIEAVLKLPDDWEKEARGRNNLNQDTKDPQARIAISLRAQAFEDCAAKVREAITAELTGKEASDDR